MKNITQFLDAVQIVLFEAMNHILHNQYVLLRSRIGSIIFGYGTMLIIFDSSKIIK